MTCIDQVTTVDYKSKSHTSFTVRYWFQWYRI